MKKPILIIFLSFLYLATFSQEVKVNKKSIKWLQENVEPIELGQQDYSFLDKYIADKRIVVLGEQLHGVKEFEIVRADIIKYLHQKHGFDVLLIESDMEAIDYINRNKKNLTPEEMLLAFHGVWYSEEMKSMIQFLQANPSIELAGFDSQFHFPAKYSFIASKYDSTYSDLLRLSYNISYDEMTNERHQVLRDSVMKLYEAQIERLPRDKNFNLSHRIIRNKINVITRGRSFSLTKKSPFYYYRDSLMADNMEWQIQEKYPNRKIIIWAATPHVAACSDCTSLPDMYFSGKKLFENKAIRDSTYILITSLFEGTSSMGNYKFAKPPYAYDGVEKLFNEIEMPSFFLDISTPKIKKRNNWINQPIKIFPIDGYSMTGVRRSAPYKYSELVPQNCFDGIIYFKKVNASTLMKRKNN
jgi:erythromycin esterase